MSRSITPAPSGSLSPDFITVPSSTGFSAGDYVYQKNGDFGLPPAGTFANFTVSPTSPVFGSTVGGVATPVLSYNVGGAADSGGSSGECAAKLSNDNIVIGYRGDGDTTGGIYFKIVDINNATIVAKTLVIAGTVSTTASVSVIALTGGGFVIHAPISASKKPGFAIYTNAGAVTTAWAADTTYPITTWPNSPLAGCALPNGGFTLAAAADAAPVNLYVRSYNATGVGAYAWATVTAYTGNEVAVGLAARSDSSVCVVILNSTTVYVYALLNASGGTITSGTIPTTSSPYQCSVACLTNDTFVIGVSSNGSALTPRFYLLPTSNVLSSAFTVPITNVPLGGGVGSATLAVQIKALSSGGFVYFLGDANGASYYVFYSAAGVAAYSVPKPFPTAVFYGRPSSRMGLVEITGYLSSYYMNLGTSTSYELYNSKIDLTTYQPYSAVTTVSPVGTTSGSVGAYARSTSLVNRAAYLAANTETLTLNATVSTGSSYIVAPASVSTDTVDSIKSATLPDGRFVIAYKNVTTQAVSFNVYSITGVLQTTVAVGTGTGTAKVRIAALPNGNVAVAYLTAAGTLTVAVYSSSFVFISSTTISTYSSGVFDVAGLSTNRIVVVYQSGSQNPQYNVYSDTLTVVQSASVILSTATTLSELNVVAGTSNGSFWTKWINTGTNPAVHYSCVVSTSANGYGFAINNATGGSTTALTLTCGLAVNPANVAVGFSASSGVNGEFYQYNTSNGGSTFANSSPGGFSTNTMSSTSNVALGVTGAGTFVCFSEGNATYNLLGFTGVATLAGTTSSTPNGLLTGINKSTSYGMQACVTPSYNYNAVIAWINSSNIAQYAIVNAYPFETTQAVTAGVTGSAPTTPLNISQSSGYYLAGVAVSDCPPGGTGQIQTNGVANLNSQYSTTTAFQGFDFQNPVTVGVKGTAVGRTVTMIKD